MDAKTIYKDYPKKVQVYMQNVIDCLRRQRKTLIRMDY